MPATLHLLDRTITFSSAAENETDILRKVDLAGQTRKFYAYLWTHKNEIEAVTAHHLHMSRMERCVVSYQDEWIHGRFNICVPVLVMRKNGTSSRKPGTVDEKMGCEVATYVWMQDNCSEISTPHLWAFAFSDGRAVKTTVKTGYVLLDYIEPTVGTMLSNSWRQHIDDPVRRGNLLKGIARITLLLARTPMPRIRSFTFHDDGTLSLSNQPLTCPLVIMENNGASRPYISDLLNYHDNRFLHQPNAINDEDDGRSQMATKTMLQSISHHYFHRSHRNGPFVLSLTDCHQSNLLVDEDWNIKYLIDLEWVCSLPVEMCTPPTWLTGQDEYDEARKEFIRILREEGKKLLLRAQGGSSVAQHMESGWANGRFWYCRCLTSVNAMYNIFDDHIRQHYYPTELTKRMDEVISKFWSKDSEDILRKKLVDKLGYDHELRRRFGEAESKAE
ncbi:hypothetical protein BDY21DRAFT_384754 [Lineolata rhizophorae]|uniref:Aminoglycoside phosphotransferase domain-containing protein n=1 Tax=Lineolata rhizophorae TaxID=578093 RepID=A0A6A6P6L5_9PEZI|nr:hypothetical protein BDY21DRAFT_384754 [Lineolata rhizophorae]